MSNCNTDKPVVPVEAPVAIPDNQNARLSPHVKLVKHDAKNIQYIKKGRFTGNVSKILNYFTTGSYLQFDYTEDSNGDVVISEKLRASNGKLTREWKMRVVNGLCIEIEDLADGTFTQFEYDQLGYKQQAKIFDTKGGKLRGTWTYAYNYNAGANTFRLGKVTFSHPVAGPLAEYTYTYNKIPNTFPLYIDQQGKIEYLPIHGKQSDVLVDQIVEHQIVSAESAKKTFSYTTDPNGFVTSMTIASNYLHDKPYSIVTQALKFSENWQGI